MNLVIVESPTKARTIGKFLGKDYEIKASMGHVVDLPKSKIGIDFEHGFTPLYEIVADKKEIIADLKSSAKSADQIILATDPDREGEAIASHIAEILTVENRKSKVEVEDRKSKLEKNKINPLISTVKDLSSTVNNQPSITRIVFHEITKEAIDEALKNPREIDKNLVDAQTARRVLDRLVGYKLSPLLWKKVRRGLSAGRVQSVALRLIVEREREIEKFGKEEYYTIHVILSKAKDLSVVRDSSASPQNDKGGTEFELIEINGDLPAILGIAMQAGKIEVAKSFKLYDGEYKVTKTSIAAEDQVKKIVDDLRTKQYVVSDVLQKEMHRSPQPPYTTSTLQQDAARRLYINGKRTMSLAQKLYEEGYITYHRTDSVAIGQTAMFSIIDFIKKEFGEKYAPEKPRFYSTKQKLAQEAHEAIRPTGLNNQPVTINKQLGRDYGRLYELIWRRAIASQMSDAVVESTTVFVDALPYKLKANGSVLVFDGFLKVNPLGLSDNKLPKFTTSEKLNLIDVLEKEHETLPPPRYNDASIIKTLEEKGIGRPSTYATIISTIESRQYIDKEEGRFFPTAIGIAVNDFLVKNFPDIDDIPFTAEMEDHLDSIAHGEKEWVPMIRDFYTPFEKKLTEVEGAERVKIAVEQTDEKCPTCGSQLVIRTGRFGKFISCSTFPECKFTKPFVEKTNFKCPKDGGDVIIKKTRRGRKFFGCSNYPKCDFAAWNLEDIKNLPNTPRV